MIIENHPHTAVLWVKVEIHPVLPTGELSGDLIHKEQKIFKIEGQDYYLCLAKLRAVLEELDKR